MHFEDTLELADEHTGVIEKIEDSGCGIFVYAGTVPNTELYTQIHLEDTLELADEHTGVIEKIEDSGCGIFVYAGTVPNTELYTQIHLEIPDAAYLFMPELFQIQSCIHRFIWKMDLFL